VEHRDANPSVRKMKKKIVPENKGGPTGAEDASRTGKTLDDPGLFNT